MREDKLTTALLTAMRHSDQPMVLSDPNLPDNPIVGMNDAFETMTGYGPATILGHNCRLLQGPGTDMDTASRIGRTLRQGQGCIEWIVNHKPDGRPYWNLLFISPVRSPDSEIRYFLGNQLDITRGFPDWLGDVQFGRANMTPEIEREFHTLLSTILEDPANDPGALARIIAKARRLAEVSTTLEPADFQPIPALAFAPLA